MLGHAPSTSFVYSEYMECLREFRIRAFGALNSNRPHLMTGKESLIKVVSDQIKVVSDQIKVVSDQYQTILINQMKVHDSKSGTSEEIPTPLFGFLCFL